MTHPARAIILITPGTPQRLDTDCTSCGWAAVWQIAAHSLSLHGVGTVATLRRCARCGAEQ